MSECIGFGRDDMERFERCSLMRGIGLEGVLKRPEVFDATMKAALLALSEEGRSFERDRAIGRLRDFLSDEAAWLIVDPESLLDALIERGTLESEPDGRLTLSFKSDVSRDRLRSFLNERRLARERLRDDKRAQLQERNRAVNAPQTAPVDRDFDQAMMRLALQQAEAAARRGEVPVGAVLVFEGEPLCADGNRVIERHDPTAHAEMLVLRQAAERLQNERLTDTTLYVTLEPCPMCACAIAHARVARVVWGADDVKNGAMGGRLDLARDAGLNHAARVEKGVMQSECERVLKTFFARRRAERLTDVENDR